MSVAYLFPGQGSHFVGMGHDYYLSHPAAKALFDEADDFLGFKLSTLCFEGDSAELTATQNQQPALYVTSMAHWAVSVAEGWPRAAYVAGHSLGEFAALTAAGSLSFLAGLHLVQQRGLLMQKADAEMPGGMAAVLSLDEAALATACDQAIAETDGFVWIANYNCPGQLVISGDSATLDVASQLAKEAGARKISRLDISIASHSPLMEKASAEFANVLEDIPVNSPTIPIISNISAEPLPSPRRIREELRRQLTEPVRWAQSMQTLQQRGVDHFIEIGPGKVLTQLMKRIDRKAKRETFSWQPEATEPS